MASVTLDHVDKVFSFTSYVRINRACFTSRECVVGLSMENVRTGSAIFARVKRTEGSAELG